MTASYRFNPMRAIAQAALGLLLAVSVTEAQQNAVLTGKVTSEAGQVLAQAQVYITEMTISVATNDQGVYTITIPAARATGQTVNLRARAIGYSPAVAQVQLNLGSQTRDFSLRRDINRLSEVTVTGSIEGTERAKVPFAIGRVTAEELPVPSLDPMRALVGKVPGLRVASSGNGRPGQAPAVMLRGPTSLNAQGRGTGPLIIVDGTIMRVGNLSEIGALDIESVEVVKGAAGASLYGTTAANGVIIIKTKRGNTRDGTTWTARAEYGVSDLSDVFYDPPVAHILQLDETGTRFCVTGSGTAQACSRSFEWMDEIYRINNNAGVNLKSPQNVQWNAVTNSGGELTNTFQANWWPVRYDAFAQVATSNPFIVNALDAAGRVGSVRYFVSGQYTTDQGGIKGLNGEQSRRARVNLDYDVRQDWRLQLSTMFSKTTTDERTGGSSNGGIWGQMLRGAPGGTDYLARDTLGRPIVRGGGSPLRGSGNGGGAFLYDMGMIVNETNSERYNASLSTTYTPTDWVTLEGSFSFDTRNSINDNYLKKGYRTFTANSGANNGNLDLGNGRQESLNGSLSATVRRELTSDLAAKATVRGQFEREDRRSESAYGEEFVVSEIYDLDNTQFEYNVGSSASSIRQLGVLGGLNLDYKGRYILDMTYRYDGSSLFGSGNRWAPFGRISAVWLASEESFWNVPGINEFRLRASRGTAGNTPRFEAQYETYTCNPNCSLGQAGNTLLKPETTTEVEVGVDFTVMDRVGVEITNASSSTIDQILPVATPAIYGFSTQWQNAGTMANKTWELALNLPIISRADLQWDVRASYDRTRTTVTNLVPPDYFTGITGQGTGSAFFFSDDPSENSGFALNRIGNIWGRSFYKSCAELPDFSISTGGGTTLTCGGPGSDFQVDDRGFVVWTGAGNGLGDGITRNLWQTKLSAADSPWGYPLFFGHPITQRPLAGQPGEGVGSLRIIGNTLPDFRLGFNSTLTWKKFTVYGLFDGTFGHELNNQAEGWGIFDHNAHSMDQSASTPVGLAKPAGYSWRVGGSEGVGTGGLYDILGPNNYNVETASYLKMRELNVSYRLGPVAGTGDWTLSLLGRNVFTITDYTGMDPETGVTGGQLGSALINGVDAFNFPTLRSFTFAISTRF